MAAVLLVASLWLFLGIVEDIVTRDQLVRANYAVFNFLQSLRTVYGDRLMVAITEMGDGAVTTSTTLAVLGWLLWRRAWRAAAYWVIAIGGAALFVPVIKFALQWPRPMALYDGWDTFASPVGTPLSIPSFTAFSAFSAFSASSWRASCRRAGAHG